MNLGRRFAPENYRSTGDRVADINAEIDRLVKKRNYAADSIGNEVLAWSYQQDIDSLLLLLTPNT